MLIESLEGYLTINQSGIVSLNALELLTRDIGIKKTIKQILQSIEEQDNHDQTAIQQQIVEELQIVKKKIDKKEIILKDKEKQLVEYEEFILQKENYFLDILQNGSKELFDKHLQRIKEAFQSNSIHANQLNDQISYIQSYIKQNRSYQQASSSFRQSQMKTSQASSGNIQKLKQKISQLEKQNAQLRKNLQDNENVDNIHSLKETNMKLKQKQSNLQSQIKVIQERIAQNSKQLCEPESPVQLDDNINPDLILKVILQIVQALNKSIPLYFGSQSSIGEILYPSYNVLCPCLVQVIPSIIFDFLSQEENNTSFDNQDKQFQSQDIISEIQETESNQ